jgi:hypothetical protein
LNPSLALVILKSDVNADPKRRIAILLLLAKKQVIKKFFYNIKATILAAGRKKVAPLIERIEKKAIRTKC